MRILDLIGSKVIELDDGRTLALNYYILTTFEEEDKDPMFGLRIDKMEDDMLEQDAVEGISRRREVVEEMASVLYRNSVTPMTLGEVVDDLVSEIICG